MTERFKIILKFIKLSLSTQKEFRMYKKNKILRY